jgi:hypothetical protein
MKKVLNDCARSKMVTCHFRKLLLGLEVFLLCAAAAYPSMAATNPLTLVTNGIPRSVFQASEKDPFLPIGFVKPKKDGSGKVKPVIVPKLDINSISITPEGSSATLKNGKVLFEGETHKFTSSAGIVTYTVKEILESEIIIISEGKEYRSKLAGPDLEKFITEEEETYEKIEP